MREWTIADSEWADSRRCDEAQFAHAPELSGSSDSTAKTTR